MLTLKTCVLWLLSLGLLLCQRSLAFDGVLTLGQRTKMERSADQVLVTRTVNSISLGFSQQSESFKWSSDLEYGNYVIQNGSPTISVGRNVSSYSLGFDVFLESNLFFGGGLGFEQERIETLLYGVNSEELGRNNYFGYFATGIYRQFNPLFMSLEVRVYGFERLDPNPSPGLMWKLGVVY